MSTALDGWATRDWGEFGWADGLPSLMTDRILQFVKGPIFQSYVGTLAVRTESLLAVADLITLSFDLNTATGVHLDVLGGILQRPRTQGQSDADYRVLLQIQVQIILSSQGSTAALMEIVALYTGVACSDYAEGFISAWVGIGAQYSGDPATLAELLRTAKAGGVALTVLLSADDMLIADYEADPVTGAGTTDYESMPITGAGSTVYEIEL